VVKRTESLFGIVSDRYPHDHEFMHMGNHILGRQKWEAVCFQKPDYIYSRNSYAETRHCLVNTIMCEVTLLNARV
jgi:hypothetical protein